VTPDYLVIGHVTKDVVPDGYAIGGTVSFASLAARRLGQRTAVLTCAEDLPDLAAYLEGIAIHRIPAAVTTTFENTYSKAGRVQYIRAVAPALTSDAVPEAWRAARVVHLGPVAQEVPPEIADVFAPDALIGATPQGWLRAWDASGRVRHVEWAHAERALARIDVLVFSPEDVGQDQALVRRYAQAAKVAVVTEDRNGCSVWHRGRCERFPAFRADEVEPTGAGDVFAAAFLTRYAEGHALDEAARFANAAASFAVEGYGSAAIPARAQVEYRLRTGQTYD
jgi:sugar/nucleoside kinase (ribokinase family)